MNYSLYVRTVTTVFTLFLLFSCVEEFETNSSYFSEVDTTTNTIIYYGEKVGDFENVSANIDWTTVDKLIVQGHINLNDIYDIRNYCKPKNGSLKDLNFKDADILEGTFDDSMFSDYDQLERFVYPRKMVSTGNDVFKGCTYLFDFELPEEVEIMGQRTIAYLCLDSWDNDLNGTVERPILDKETYAIPSMVTELGVGCYMYYPYATIDIPDSVESFGVNCFANSDLESFTMPDQITFVEQALFKDCDKLKEVTLHDGITEIRESAFWDCSALEKLIMPESVTEVKAYFINKTYNLKEIVWSPNITSFPENCLMGIAMEEVHIPESVTSLGRHCFRSSTSKRFYFHKNISSLGEGLFNDEVEKSGSIEDINVGIEELHVEWTTPPDAGNAFLPTVDFTMATTVYGTPDYSTVKLYVPIGTKEAYENAEGWNLFGEVIEE